MPHRDWILSPKQKRSQQYQQQEAMTQLRDGFVSVILIAIYRLDVTEARRLYEVGKEFLGGEDRFRKSAAALAPLLENVEQLVRDGALSVNKPRPFVSARQAEAALKKSFGWDIGIGAFDDGSWRTERLIETSDGCFVVSLAMEPRGSSDPPLGYLEDYLYRFYVSVKTARMECVVEEKHITFQACLDTIRKFLAQSPLVSDDVYAD